MEPFQLHILERRLEQLEPLHIRILGSKLGPFQLRILERMLEQLEPMHIRILGNKLGPFQLHTLGRRLEQLGPCYKLERMQQLGHRRQVERRLGHTEQQGHKQMLVVERMLEHMLGLVGHHILEHKLVPSVQVVGHKLGRMVGLVVHHILDYKLGRLVGLA